MKIIFATLLFALMAFNTIELSSQSDKIPVNNEILPKNKELPARRSNSRRIRMRRPYYVPGIITFSDSSSSSSETSPPRHFGPRTSYVPGIITFSDSSSSARRQQEESGEINSPQHLRPENSPSSGRITLPRVDSAGSTSDHQNQERFVHHRISPPRDAPSSPGHSSSNSNDWERIVSDSRSSGKHIGFKVHCEWKGVGIEGTECNLYYPSTISAKRIEGARISVITSNTPNNIIPVAQKQVL